MEREAIKDEFKRFHQNFGLVEPTDLNAEVYYDFADAILALLSPKEKVADEMFEALEEIQKGEGAYSPDQLEHAQNTINNMKSIASDMVDKLKDPS